MDNAQNSYSSADNTGKIKKMNVSTYKFGNFTIKILFLRGRGRK